jgi:hypothetical protein
MPSALHPQRMTGRRGGAHQPGPAPVGPDGWDSGAVSRPYLVPADPTDPTSRARLYYLGRSADGARHRQGIGVAESDDPLSGGSGPSFRSS